MVITIDFELSDKGISSSTYESLSIEQKIQTRGMIFRGLKRTAQALSCLQEQKKLSDPRVFSLDMEFSDISFAAEHKMDGKWNRSNIVFGKTFERDGYEIDRLVQDSGNNVDGFGNG